jgi:hypothetical protein
MFRRNVKQPYSGQNKPSQHTESKSGNSKPSRPTVRCCETPVSFYQYRGLLRTLERGTLHSYGREGTSRLFTWFQLFAGTDVCTLLRHRRQFYSRVGRGGGRRKGRDVTDSDAPKYHSLAITGSSFSSHEDTSWALCYRCHCYRCVSYVQCFKRQPFIIYQFNQQTTKESDLLGYNAV